MKWLTPSTARQKSLKLRVVEPRRRIVPLEVRQRRGVDEQRQRQLAVVLPDQQLLARRTRHAGRRHAPPRR